MYFIINPQSISWKSILHVHHLLSSELNNLTYLFEPKSFRELPVFIPPEPKKLAQTLVPLLLLQFSENVVEHSHSNLFVSEFLLNPHPFEDDPLWALSNSADTHRGVMVSGYNRDATIKNSDFAYLGGRSEGFYTRTGYFIPGRHGIGAGMGL